MRALSLDPGGDRAGWAILDGPSLSYVNSGIFGLPPGDNYQQRRLALIRNTIEVGNRLFDEYRPELFVSEIVPPTGGSIPSIINRQQALTVVTTMQALAYAHNCSVVQVGATTVKKHVTGSGKATKVAVRNGVLGKLPQLETRRSEWTGKTAVFDEIDAIAVGIYGLDLTGDNGN